MSENLENILCLIIDMCRICLDNHGSKDLLASTSLALDVYKYTGIKVTASDKLPTQICNQCLNMVEIAKELRSLAEKSANKLKKFISTKQKDDEPFGPDAMVQIPDTNYNNKKGISTKKAEADKPTADNADGACPRQMIQGPGISDAAGLLVIRSDLYEEYVPEYVGASPRDKDVIKSKEFEKNKYELNKDKITKKSERSQIVEPTRSPEKVKSKSSSEKLKFKTSLEKKSSKTNSEIVTSKNSVKVDKRTKKYRKRMEETKRKKEMNEKPRKSKQKELSVTNGVSPDKRKPTGYEAINIQKQKILERVKRLTRQSLEMKCNKCAKDFKSHKALSLHMRLHIRPEVCHYCSKRFGYKNDLAKHIRTHTGEKPYKCTLCEKAFAQNGTLKAHMETVHASKRQS